MTIDPKERLQVRVIKAEARADAEHNRAEKLRAALVEEWVAVISGNFWHCKGCGGTSSIHSRPKENARHDPECILAV